MKTKNKKQKTLVIVLTGYIPYISYQNIISKEIMQNT